MSWPIKDSNLNKYLENLRPVCCKKFEKYLNHNEEVKIQIINYSNLF